MPSDGTIYSAAGHLPYWLFSPVTIINNALSSVLYRGNSVLHLPANTLLNLPHIKVMVPMPFQVVVVISQALYASRDLGKVA